MHVQCYCIISDLSFELNFRNDQIIITFFFIVSSVGIKIVNCTILIKNIFFQGMILTTPLSKESVTGVDFIANKNSVTGMD